MSFFTPCRFLFYSRSIYPFLDSANIRQTKGLPPKCKNNATRAHALELLDILCVNSPQNLSKVIDSLLSFHTYNNLVYFFYLGSEANWRTNRPADWAISPDPTEKSEFGFVGLKNLGASTKHFFKLIRFSVLYEFISATNVCNSKIPESYF
jgi:hypothetical protein